MCVAVLPEPLQVDLKAKNIFLKKTKVEGINSANLYIGAAVNILSRQVSLMISVVNTNKYI